MPSPRSRGPSAVHEHTDRGVFVAATTAGAVSARWEDSAMTDTQSRPRAPGIGRLGTAAAWLSALCCLPYLVLKVLWTVGVPVGITDLSVLDSDAWVAANGLMAVIQLAGLVLVLALSRRGRAGHLGGCSCSPRGSAPASCSRSPSAL